MVEVPASTRGGISLEDRPLEEVLYGTLSRLQRLRQQEPTVAAYIERWCEHRQETIDVVIPTLQETVKTVCSRCNTGRTVGAVASVGGLLTAFVGAVLKFNGVPAGDQVLQGGTYLTAAGSVVILSSTVIEACSTLSRTKEIKERIQKDIELTERVRRWIDFSNEVEVCFDKWLQCNIASPGFLRVMKVLEDCISLINAGTYEIGDLIRDLRRGEVRGIGNATADVIRNVVRFLERIRDNPNIRKPLNEICKIARENISLIQLVKTGFSVYKRTYGILPSLPFSFESSNWKCLGLDVVKMLYDLVNNIKFEEIKERQTAYFGALKKVQEALESELTQVKNSLNEREAGYETLVQELNDMRL